MAGTLTDQRARTAVELLSRLGVELPEPEHAEYVVEAVWPLVSEDGGPPAERLRLELAEARRATGAPFDLVWRGALLRALAGSYNDKERRAWESSLIATKAAWRAGYDGVADPAEWARALAAGTNDDGG